MANGHGGARPGAGRKARADKHAGQIAAAEQKIADRLPDLVENLLILASGAWVQGDKCDDQGKPLVYLTPPDRSANVYLLDRILGKPTNRCEVSGEDGQPFKVYVGVDVDRVCGIVGPPSGEPAV
jgi:hypothetical protein